jgi:hypothetical protein
VELAGVGMVAGICGKMPKKKYIVFLGYCCDFGVTGVTGVTGFFICYLSIV